MSKLDDMLGSWAPHIGGEFYKPYMKTLHEEIEFKKKDVFQEFEPMGNLFEVFKKTPYDEVKVLVILDTPKFKKEHLYNIEAELCGGLDIPLTTRTDYDHLNKQGVMFFPMCLSYGETPHKEWRVFTEEVILHVTGNKNILVSTSDASITGLLHETRPWTDFISQLQPWKTIDDWVKKHYNCEIKWSPTH